MNSRRRYILLAAISALALLSSHHVPAAEDRLAAEVARWSAFVAADTASDSYSRQVRQATEPALAVARDALARGRRSQALLRFAGAHTLLAAIEYSRAHAEAGRDLAALEAEWKRASTTLLDADPAALARTLEGVRPAVVRAIGEAAAPQVRIFHEASLEYARSTMPDAGVFYLGEAHAQRRFVELCASLGEPSRGREPRFRSLAVELDSLNAEMLSVYRPPLSIDRHAEFINASAALKEARELDLAGLPRAALLRYLQATLRFQPLRPRPPAFDSAATPARLAAFEARVADAATDHSVGQLFLEVARADLEDTTRGATRANAAAIAEVVMPRYFAALEPAPRRAAAPAPRVTVTLVRWPYT